MQASDGTTKWPDEVTSILGGDVCVALAYRTPAGGVVLTPVTTIGMFDEEEGTVTTTSSFGNWKKLVRIAADDRVALVYHARDHGRASTPHLIVAQGRASFPDRPDRAWVTPEAAANIERFLPLPRTGRFWSWVGREYAEERVPIVVSIHRMSVYDKPTAAEPSLVIGAPPADEPAPAQTAPRNGTEPRVAAKRYSKRLAKTRHRLIGFTDAEGFPTARVATFEHDGDSLIVDAPSLPPGGRRAGVLAHWFEPQLIGQGSVLLTGWLDVDETSGIATYSPHTTSGYALPASKFLFSVGGGLAAKLGYRKAVKAGHVRDGVWQRTTT
jgi:hypothetical protein